MEKLEKYALLEFYPNTLQLVREECGLTNLDLIKQSIDILEHWLAKQQHFLKKDFSKATLERLLITGKGSVERAKKKLDQMCTVKTLLPHFFTTIDIRLDLKPFENDIKLAVIPKLTQKQERVCIFKSYSIKHDDALPCFKSVLKVCEYVRAYDYNSGCIAILDYSASNLTELLPKINPIELHQMIYLVTDSLTMRPKGMHLISSSSLINILLNMMKSALSNKLRERMFVHKNYESLRSVVPDDVLPSDFGGTQRSMDELHDDLIESLTTKEFLNYLDDLWGAKTNEKLRRKESFNEHYLGSAGSFRAIEFD